MTTDIKELKRLASSAELGCLSHGNKRSFAELDAFHVAAHPSAVLNLIAKIEQLEGQLSAQTAEPAYAHEYGRSNGDGTFRVEIVRGEVKPHHSPCKDWPIKPLYTHPAKTEQPSLSDEQVWDIYVKATNAVMNTDGRTFAIALTRAILAQRQDSNKDEAARRVKG